MHNTHYIVVNAENTDEAISLVENTLDNFGTEDNWYNIDYTINLNNPTVQELNKLKEHLLDLNKEIEPNKLNEVKDDIKLLQSRANDTDRHYYWELGQLYNQLYEILGATGEYTLSNILSGVCSNYNGYKYDEYGYTDLSDYDEDSDDNLYFCIIDMHS